MKITDVRGYSLSAALHEPFEWPDGRAYRRTAGVVRIETDEGLVGWGPANPGWNERVAASARPALLGQSPLDTLPLWKRMADCHLPFDVRGALDVALWDLKGKLLGQPVHRLLGGALRDRVPAYATGGYYLLPEDSLDWLQTKACEAVERGFRAYKMKVGGRSLAKDLERIDAVRAVLGPERWLAVDATTTYTVPLALQMGRQLERRGIAWFEDPLSGDDVSGYERLSAALDVPITAHYAANSSTLFELIRRRAVHQVQPAVEPMGGYTKAQQVAGMCALHGVVLKPSCWSTHLHIAATLHLLAVLPSQRTVLADAPPPLEFDTSENPLRDDSLLLEPIEVEPDGMVRVPDGPGLGICVDEDKLAQYANSGEERMTW